MTSTDEKMLNERVYEQPKVSRPRDNDDNGWWLQVSLKTPRGALINIRGANSFDLQANLEAIKALAFEILETENAFQPEIPVAVAQGLGGYPANQQQPQQYQQGPPPSFVPQQPQQQPGNAPLCQHNIPAKYVPGGMSKTGRPYVAFFACSLPQGQQCQFRQNA